MERQQTVLDILQGLDDLDGLKRLFWQELNYERENKPLSSRQWTESARQPLAEVPILFASGGEDGAFHVMYCRLASPDLKRGLQRPVVSQLLRDHPYALFVFSNQDQTAWHFLNVKYDAAVEKRQLLRRIAVRSGEGLRTAAERLALLDLHDISPNLFGLSPLRIQQRHDEAFDVEKVTKEFYREIANWYFWALKHVTFPKDAPKEKDGHDHISVIRLITRLIFCWFIREKGLIPDALFDERTLTELLEGFEPENDGNTNSVFYRAILQNLFFATLNTEMDQRKWRHEGQHFMAHSLYRHRACFRDPESALELFKNIPFLNGGLFECLDKDFGEGVHPRYLRIDGFSDRPDSRPTVPDFLFFGPEQEVDLSEDYGDKKYRKVRVRGLIATLNRYTFTIEENTPLDQEVALDPELCGKVFENLLAAYNPETGTTARKATGSFYTPREIVDYMVEEALVAYLKGKLVDGVDRVDATGDLDSRLRALLSYDVEKPAFSEAETERLIEAIDNLKALDPACGSGAFPMGMLHKLVQVLGKLDPDNERWKAKQIAKLDDAVMREEAERVFRDNYDDYGRKLYLIENCIYGVDIQPIAVQIAKMRFFISLIVDQKVNPAAPNLGVRALPNLETKFVAANTLIGIEGPDLQGKLFGNHNVEHLKAKLRDVRHRMFTARTLSTKNKLRREDAALRQALAAELKKAIREAGTEKVRRLEEELAKARKELEALQAKPVEWQITRARNLFGEEVETRVDPEKEKKRELRALINDLNARLKKWSPVEDESDAAAKQLAAWDPYDQNASSPFFDPEWMFGMTDGFDIVIGNPPYVRQEQIKEHKPTLARNFECFVGTADLYVYFYEAAITLLRDGGILSFISSNKWYRAAYGEKLRQWLLKHGELLRVIDFGDAPVFTAIAYPTIVVLKKGRTTAAFNALIWKSEWPLETFADRIATETVIVEGSALKPGGWNLASSAAQRLLEKLRKSGKPLGEYVEGRFYRGILTGFNEAFVVDRATRDRLIAEHKSSAEVLKPFLRGRDVKRWRCEFAEQWLIKIESSENKAHPWSWKPDREAERVFAQTYPAIHAWLATMRKPLINRYDQGNFFWELRACAYWQEFEQPKIVFPDIAPSAQFAWEDQSMYLVNTSYILLAPIWVLSVLNSAAIQFFYTKTSNAIRGGYLRYIRQYVSQIPIPAATPPQQKEIEELVTKILALKQADPAADTSTLEREIDERVYRLYGLTAEEIAIVEGAARG